jgi:hypothetical protein
MKWNKEDWQGKSKQQVDFSYKIGFYSTVIITIVFGVLISMLLAGCKSSEKIDCDAYSMVESK